MPFIAGALFTALLVSTLPSRALPGDLDTSFGSGGIVTTAIGSGDDTASGVVAQPDGKMVVAGTTYNGSNKDFAVVRYNADGTLDTTFNGTGKVTADFRGFDDVCNGVILQDDGKIVVVGYSSDGTRNDFALARFNTNGTLDTGFGQAGTGKVVTTGICTNSEGTAVALQPDGKVVMVGRVKVGYWQPAVVRYNPDGTIDNDFGSGGLWHYPLSLYNEYNDGCAFGVAVQGDGTIIVTGQSTGWGYYSYVCTFRMDAGGKLIGTGFGGVVGPISSIVSNAVAMQADGKILTADSDFRLMCFLGNGTLDTSFGGNGVVNTGIGVGSNVAKGLVLQGDGRIVAAGYTYNANTGVNDFALVRYNTDGTPDTGFHGAGIVTTHIGAGDSYGQSVALQVDGRILVAGNSISGGKSRFTVVRYEAFGNLAVTSPANGGFVNNSRPVISGSADANATVNIYLDGAISGSALASSAGAWNYTPSDPHADGTHTVSATEMDGEGHPLATSNTNNFTVDTTPPPAPVVSAPASGAYVNNTRPYISGMAEANARVTIYLDAVQAGTVTANGSGAWGFVPATPLADGPHTLKAAATDRAGNTGVFSSDIAFRSSNITSGTPGNLDTGFGSGGIVTTAIGSGDDTASGVAVQIDGKIVVAGTSYNGSNKDFAVVRYNPDGTLDTTFNGTGKVTTDFRGHDDVCSGMVLQDDGKIVVVGYSSNGTRNDFSMARYNTDGTLDTSFGQLGTGKVITTGICTNSEAYAVTLQPDGKFVMVGRVQVDYWQPAVVRYNPDGTIDNDFGSGGLWHYPLSLYGEYYGSCAFGVAVQGDGTIVVTGQSTGWGYYSYDCTFRMDTGGKMIGTGFGGVVGPISSIVSNAVAMQTDGKILTADSDFRLMRFMGEGSFDTSFGGNGVVNTGIGVGSNVAKGLVLQGDGRIVAAGYTYNANTGVNDFALVRFNTDGTPDTGFHGAGIVTTHIGAGDSYGQSVALQVDGRILVAGNSISGGKSRFTVARYYGTDQPPIVQTGATTVVTKTSATLNGTVNPNSLETTAYFEYGLDTNYGNVTGDQACGYGLNAVIKSSSIRDLAPNTVYHFRLVARNSAALFGGVTYGKDATFTTEPDPPVDVTAAAIGVGSSGATLAAVVFPNGRETTVHFEYGLTTAYDNSTAAQIIPAGTGAVNVFAMVAGLVPGGTYHFRVVATNSGTPVPIPGLDLSFVANDPPPTVSTGAASQLTTTSARVNGTVRTHNAASQVFFEYGTDGVAFPSSVAATPSTVTGDLDTPVSADLANLAQTVTYYYRVRAVSNGGTSYGQIGSFKLNLLSGLIQGFPGAPPDAEGYVFVTLIPSGINSGWRFVGEQQWRPSILPVGGLTTGDRQIEFRPVPGYIQPLQESISVISGGLATLVTGEYYPTPGSATGGMSVVLKPDALADAGLPVDQRAQWRFLGEDDTHWRNSGVTVGGLPAGNYLVESKPVTGRATPAVITVSVDLGATKVATATYYLASATTGTVPSVVSFDTVSTNQTLPYAYVGQIRSDLGSATGFVVKPRVVATAAHVVFDDGTLSYVSSLQWLFQRDRGTYEPTPQIPRGFYVFDGYASQRTAEATPGASTPQSQNLDAAALYFLEDAGRGGYGGWLASDLDNNEFLLSTKMKMLVGYPVDGIATLKQGRMHATPAANIAFTKAFGRTFTTSDIRSAGGNSGGPLCVQADNGNYYPAAIYLGGSGQTVVRAIDSQVIDLFNRAEVSANGGDDHLGGGIITIRPPVIAPPPAPASLQVSIEPVGAVAAGATWNVGGAACASGASISLPAGTYTLTCTGASGFMAPVPSTITLSSGQGASVGRTYSGITAHPAGLTAAAGGNATFSVGVSGTPSAYQWRRNGTDIPGATSSTYTRSNLTATDTGNYSVVVTWGGSGSLTSNAAALDVTAASGFDAWRALNFTATELLDALKSGPTADYDHDGICNLLEYALNLDPKTADATTMIAGTGTSGLPLVRVENVGGQNRLTVEFVRRKAASTPGITYAVEFSSGLSNGWSSTGTETITPIDTTWERVKTTDQQSSSPYRFTRLKVTQP